MYMHYIGNTEVHVHVPFKYEMVTIVVIVITVLRHLIYNEYMYVVFYMYLCAIFHKMNNGI